MPPPRRPRGLGLPGPSVATSVAAARCVRRIRLVALALAGVTAVAPPAGAEDGADLAARVGSEVVLRSTIKEACRDGDRSPGQGPSERLLAEATALEQLVDQALLARHLEREGITVSDEEIEAARIRRQRERPAATGSDADAAPAAADQRLRLQVGVAKLLEPKLTDKVLAAALERHRRELDGTRLQVSHVILRPDIGVGEGAIGAAVRRADAIRQEILSGRLAFAEAARRHSAGPSRHAGGTLGWIGRHEPCVEGFSERVFALAKGEVSKPFVTAFGVHLVIVQDAQPGRVTTADLRPRVRALVMNRMVEDIVARARSTTAIEYAAGVARFDPGTPAASGLPRRVLVSQEAVRVGPGPAAGP